MTSTKRYFEEKQRMNQWFIWVVLLLLNGITAVAVYVQIIEKHPVGNNPMSNVGLIILSVLMVAFTAFILSVRLEIQIDSDHIAFKLSPFHVKTRIIKHDELQSIAVRKYKPILEYGGWGLRGFGKNVAYNISGNQGIQLELKNGKRILLGTQNPDAAREALHAAGYNSGK
jgi:hypothetical protein